MIKKTSRKTDIKRLDLQIINEFKDLEVILKTFHNFREIRSSLTETTEEHKVHL